MTRPSVLEPAPAPGDAPPGPAPSVIPAIDEALRCTGNRQFIPTSEVVDLLLDLRLVARLEELLAAK
jgi:hypothetical protein